MSTNLLSFPDPRRSREQAALWLTRLDRGLAADERTDLRQWLGDVTNHKALVEMARLWRGMDIMSVLAELFPLSTSRLNRPPARSFQNMLLSAVAAASIVALLTVFMLGQPPWKLFAPKATPMAVPNEGFGTGVGETRAVHPGDGSTITMNTNSAMVLIYSPRARDVYLLRGEASFSIQPDMSRPFYLHAGKRVLEAAGGADFNLRVLSAERLELTVSDGRVKVVPVADAVYIPEAPRVAPIIARRESLVYEQEFAVIEPHEETVRRLEPTELDVRLAWQRGMLGLENEPLEQALSEASRYTNTEFVLADEALHRAHVSGYFRTGDVDGLLIALRLNYGIESRREGPNRVILTAAPVR
jgi:transmembrane sensor